MNAEAAAALRKPFDPAAVGKKPQNLDRNRPKERCGTCDGYHHPASLHIDYVGHAAVTERLLEVDPDWTWEPIAFGPEGLPVLERDERGRAVGMWIRLTVAGVTRPGYGTCAPEAREPVKELIGDALRNAAMRFGVALDLWKRETEFADGRPDGRRRRPTRTAPAPVDTEEAAQAARVRLQAELDRAFGADRERARLWVLYERQERSWSPGMRLSAAQLAELTAAARALADAGAAT